MKRVDLLMGRNVPFDITIYDRKKGEAPISFENDTLELCMRWLGTNQVSTFPQTLTYHRFDSCFIVCVVRSQAKKGFRLITCVEYDDSKWVDFTMAKIFNYGPKTYAASEVIARLACLLCLSAACVLVHHHLLLHHHHLHHHHHHGAIHAHVHAAFSDLPIT